MVRTIGLKRRDRRSAKPASGSGSPNQAGRTPVGPNLRRTLCSGTRQLGPDQKRTVGHFGGSGPYFVMVTSPLQVATRTRLRSSGKPARPYIWRLIILILLTVPSTTPDRQGRVRPFRTAS